MLRARFAHPQERVQGRALQAVARAGAVSCPWSRLFFLDPLAVEALGAEFQDRLMPEPVEQWDPTPSDEARSRLGLAGLRSPRNAGWIHHSPQGCRRVGIGLCHRGRWSPA